MPAEPLHNPGKGIAEKASDLKKVKYERMKPTQLELYRQKSQKCCLILLLMCVHSHSR